VAGGRVPPLRAPPAPAANVPGGFNRRRDASSRVRDWDAFNQEYEQRERERLRALGEADFHVPKRPRRYGRACYGPRDEAPPASLTRNAGAPATPLGR